MKIAYAAALAIAAVSAPAFAQAAEPAAAVAVKRGATIFSSDGHRLGRVDRVRGDDVGMIYNGKYVTVPAATLTAADRGFKTSLTREQLGN